MRFGDSYLVHDAELGRRVIDDRNAATPVGLLPHGLDATDPATLDELVRKYVEYLELAPPPRSHRRGSLLDRVRRELAARRAAERLA